MPGFNRKGVNNEGPMTGRGIGLCNPETKNLINRKKGYYEVDTSNTYYSAGGRRAFFGGRRGKCEELILEKLIMGGFFKDLFWTKRMNRTL